MAGGHVAATVQTFADANYDVVPLGATANGASAVEELLTTLFDAFPDFEARVESLHHGDDIILTDPVITGTHRGTQVAVPATGRPMKVRCGCAFHFDQEHLVKETVYFDHVTLLALAQLGVAG